MKRIRMTDEQIAANLARIEAHGAGPTSPEARIIRQLMADAERMRKALAEALRVMKDCTDYQHSGDSCEENTFDMGEMEIHEYVSDGRYEKAAALSTQEKAHD